MLLIYISSISISLQLQSWCIESFRICRVNVHFLRYMPNFCSWGSVLQSETVMPVTKKLVTNLRSVVACDWSDARSQGGFWGLNPQKDFLEMGLKSLWLYLWYRCTKMLCNVSRTIYTKTPQITVCCKTSNGIVFILLSVQNLISWFSGRSSKLLPKDVRF